jgi:hypothetical protein
LFDFFWTWGAVGPRRERIIAWDGTAVKTASATTNETWEIRIIPTPANALYQAVFSILSDLDLLSRLLTK